MKRNYSQKTYHQNNQMASRGTFHLLTSNTAFDYHPDVFPISDANGWIWKLFEAAYSSISSLIKSQAGELLCSLRAGIHVLETGHIKTEQRDFTASRWTCRCHKHTLLSLIGYDCVSVQPLIWGGFHLQNPPFLCILMCLCMQQWQGLHVAKACASRCVKTYEYVCVLIRDCALPAPMAQWFCSLSLSPFPLLRDCRHYFVSCF